MMAITTHGLLATSRASWSSSLFWRVLAINTAVLVVAALVLALSPASVSDRILLVEAPVLTVALALVLAVKILLLRRVFEPLQQGKPVAEFADLSAVFKERRRWGNPEAWDYWTS